MEYRKKPHYLKIIKDSGFNEYELKTGLWPAIEKFLYFIRFLDNFKTCQA